MEEFLISKKSKFLSIVDRIIKNLVKAVYVWYKL